MIDTGMPTYRRSARTDFRMWLLLAFGLIFFWTGSMLRPDDNCSEDGRECAPWLVPLAQGFGALVGLAALANMLANPRRGSFVVLRFACTARRHRGLRPRRHGRR